MNAGVSFEKEKVKKSQSQSRSVAPPLDTHFGCRVGGVTVKDLLTKNTGLNFASPHSLNRAALTAISEAAM